MLRFRVLQYRLGRSHYLLLPKLNPVQMAMVAARLARLGTVSVSPGSVASRLNEGVIHVESRGVCWSRVDPSDAILPIVPDLLSSRKVKVSTRDMMEMYYRLSRSQRVTSVCLSPRLESGPPWRGLRASGDCALAPDEHAILSSLLRSESCSCEVVTDYPCKDPLAFRLGSRRYFQSVVGSGEAASNLREAGSKGWRNSYILRDGFVRLHRDQVSLREDAGLFEELGEWCFFTC